MDGLLCITESKQNSSTKLIHLALSVIIAILLCPSISHAEPKEISYTIGRIMIDDTLQRIARERAISLLPIQTGDRITLHELDEIQRQLAQSGLFKRVEFSTQRHGKTLNLTVKLEDALLIRRVKVSGNYPFLSKKLLRLSSLQPGDPLDEDQMQTSIERIKTYLAKAGYLDAEVSITPIHKKKAPGFVNLRIKVNKGKRYRVGDVEFTGNEVYSDQQLRNMVKGFGRYQPRKIKDQLNKIQKRYINRGYVRARLRVIKRELDKERHRANLNIAIKERLRVHVLFDGNRYFSPQTLDDHITLFKERSYNSFAIERSTTSLTDFYHFNGFAHAHVEATVAKQTDGIWVTFHIHEGPRLRLKEIRFSGNNQVSKGKLLKVFEASEHSLTAQGLYNEETTLQDLTRVEPLYHALGFFDARVKGWTIDRNEYGDKRILTIVIDEGEPYRLAPPIITGHQPQFSTDLHELFAVKFEKFYDQKKVQKTRKRLIQHYLDHGYPHADIEIERTLSPTLKEAQLIYRITEGPRVTVRSITIQGSFKTKMSTIRDALKIKAGDPYRYKDVLTGQLNLKRLGIFDQVRITTLGLEQKKPEVDLVIHLHELQNYNIDVQAGFDSDKLASGQLILTKRNLLGLGKQLQFRGVGGFELNRGEVTFSSPRLFGASWNLINQYFAQYEDDENFNATSFGGSIGALKNYGPDWTLLLKAELARFNIFESESNQNALVNNLFDSTFMEYLISLAYDTRDNYADPQKGLNIVVATEFDTDVANVANNFNISRISAAHYFGFFKRFTLVNNIRVGKLFRINPNTRIPAQKLFFMGGNDTVRGFDEDAILGAGGTTSVIYNVELQYRLFNGFKLAGFFDAGSLTEEFVDISRNTVREAAGIGLRYITPVGPIRLDYGWVLDKRSNEKGQRFHFSFGYYF